MAGFIYFIASWIVVKLKIDDPLDAVAGKVQIQILKSLYFVIILSLHLH